MIGASVFMLLTFIGEFMHLTSGHDAYYEYLVEFIAFGLFMLLLILNRISKSKEKREEKLKNIINDSLLHTTLED